jgi:hypothetical protein
MADETIAATPTRATAPTEGGLRVQAACLSRLR